MKVLKPVIFLLGLLFIQQNLCSQYSGGIGTESDPYQMSSSEDIIALSANQGDWSGKHFVLVKDIDMQGQSITPIGRSGSSFSGSFNGNMHSISNLSITPFDATSGTGLFGDLSGHVSYLGIVDIDMDIPGISRTGSIAGIMSGNASIRFSYSIGGRINVGGGGWAGGIAGLVFSFSNITIEDCFSTDTILATWASGGIIGANRGPSTINRVAFYGKITGGSPITTVQNDPANNDKNGIPPTNAFYNASNEASDPYATALDEAGLLDKDSYTTFEFDRVWVIDPELGYAVLNDSIEEAPLPFFENLAVNRVRSNDSIVWKQFGPGMSGYNEEFWCHPTDTNVMFMGPDMHVAYGTWDNGNSWHTIKDCDGDGWDLERVMDIQFSLLDPDYGVAIERRGKVFETKDRGRTWKLIYFIPNASAVPWYNAHSKLAIHPTNDSIWYIGAGGFWDVKANHRSLANPHGQVLTNYAYGYVLKTTDRGKTWTYVARDISDNLDVGRIRINPNHPDSVVMATGHGMFLSADAGASWQASNTGLPNNLPKDLAAYYNPDTREYVLYTVEHSVYTTSGNTIATSGGVFKSTDGGVNWEDITGNLGLDFTVITNYFFRDNYAKAVAYWLGVDKSVITAKEYPEQTLPVFRRLVVDPGNKDVLYLVPNQRHDKSFGPGDVWKTDDGGNTWKIAARHGTYWITGENSSYWKDTKQMASTAPNVSFAHLQNSMDASNEASSANRHLAINENGHVFIGINQQTIRSNDGGASWKQIDDYETVPGSEVWIGRGTSDLPGRFILSETGIPGRVLLCTGEHGLFQTADIGDWPDKDAVGVKQIQGQVNDHSGNHDAHSISTVAVHPNDPNTIFTLAWRQEHRGWLRKTTNGGKTWGNVVQLFDAANNSWENVAHQTSLMIDPDNPDHMYFAAVEKPIGSSGTGGYDKNNPLVLTMGEFGVYRSVDGGNSWLVSKDWIPSGGSVNKMVMHPDNPEVLYAALNQYSSSDPYGLYVSNDKAVNWSEVTIPSDIRSVNNVFIDRNTKHIYISCGHINGDNNSGGVYRSKDNGGSWEKIFDAPYMWYAETSPVNPDMILVCIGGQKGNYKNPGLYLSKDDGATWTKINKGLGQPNKIVDIEFDPYNENIMYCAGWGSGWHKAMLPYDSVSALCEDSYVVEGDEVLMFAGASLGSQLNYEWLAPDGISLSSRDAMLTSFTAPLLSRDSTLNFQLKVWNEDDSDSLEVKVHVHNIINVESVSFEKDSLEILVGSDTAVTATVLPQNAENKNLHWESNAEGIAAVSNEGFISARAEGEAIVVVSTEDGGFKDTLVVTVMALPSSLEDLVNDEHIALYPNPVSEELTIVLPHMRMENAVITIYNITGVAVKQVLAPDTSGESIKIPTAVLQKGMYILQIHDGRISFRQKFHKI